MLKQRSTVLCGLVLLGTLAQPIAGGYVWKNLSTKQRYGLFLGTGFMAGMLVGGSIVYHYMKKASLKKTSTQETQDTNKIFIDHIVRPYSFKAYNPSIINAYSNLNQNEQQKVNSIISMLQEDLPAKCFQDFLEFKDKAQIARNKITCKYPDYATMAQAAKMYLYGTMSFYVMHNMQAYCLQDLDKNWRETSRDVNFQRVNKGMEALLPRQTFFKGDSLVEFVQATSS